MKILFFLSLIIFFLYFIFSDIPVHCIFKDIAGEWTFEYSKDKNPSSIIQKCGFHDSFEVVGQLKLKLLSPNIVEDEHGNRGTWTFVYDEAFEIKINGLIYFAYFSYRGESNSYVSQCGITFTGTFHEDGVINPSNWGCFKGVKKVQSNEKPFSISKREFHLKRFNVLKSNKKLVDEINLSNLGWTAKEYTGPKITMKVSSMGKIRNEARKEHMKLFEKYRKEKKTEYKDLPAEFSWTNVSGIDYVGPARNQGGCGSCYAFGATGMFDSRNKINSKMQDQTLFSPQYIVNCDKYNQGCSGGFTYTVSKWGNDFGIYPDECYPYHGSEQQCKDSPTCGKDKIRFTYDRKYIGGYYGACTEQGMMQELYDNGPISVEFEVYSDFYSYHSGIYQHKKMVNDDPKWEQTNHVVTLVGWGIENGKKYWIVRNSWGTSWGMKGFFWIIRGTDDCAIESSAVSSKIH